MFQFWKLHDVFTCEVVCLSCFIIQQKESLLARIYLRWDCGMVYPSKRRKEITRFWALGRSPQGWGIMEKTTATRRPNKLPRFMYVMSLTCDFGAVEEWIVSSLERRTWSDPNKSWYSVHSMPWEWCRWYLQKKIFVVKKVIKIKRLIFTSELWLDSSPTKSQSDWMCGIYSRRSTYMSYQVCLSVYPYVYLCIGFPLTSNLGSGDVKFVLHNSSIKPRASPRFTCYNRVYYITPARRY